MTVHYGLTHWDLNKTDAVLQEPFSSAMSSKKSYEFSFEFQLRLLLEVQLKICQQSWWWLVTIQTPSHYQIQFWPKSTRAFSITRIQWVKFLSLESLHVTSGCETIHNFSNDYFQLSDSASQKWHLEVEVSWQFPQQQFDYSNVVRNGWWDLGRFAALVKVVVKTLLLCLRTFRNFQS